MKQLIPLLLICNVALSQQPLAITTDKTSSLIFPFPIKYVDRGTNDLLVQPLKENDNILMVKAAAKQFKETNLSVVTGDGSVYSYTVNYKERPSEFIYHLPVNRKASIATYANAILDNKPSIRVMRVEKYGIKASIIGIYIKDDVIFYQLLLCNHSPLDYDIDVLRFFTKDKRKTKRTAVQENDRVPLYTAGNKSKVKAHDFSVVVVALEKFTIPDAKFLGVQIMEKNGGRHFQLKINNGHIMKAVPLPELR